MNIVIRGLDELNKKFSQISGDLKPALKEATGGALKYIHSSLPPYPAPPSGSTYARTQKLQAEIFTEVKSLGSEIVGVIGSPTVYAPYVIDEDRQAWMHRRRWWTLQAQVRKARDVILNTYRDAIQALLRR